MIQDVVDIRGTHIGYLVGDFFVGKKYEKFISTNWGTYDKVSSRKLCSTVINIGDLRVNVLFFPFKLTNYNEFISLCKKEGLILNDILFMPIKYSDLDLDNLTALWRLSKGARNRNTHTLMCIDSNRECCCGYMMSHDILFSSKSYYIETIESIKTKSGYGTRIVNQLKSFGIQLSGLSLVASRGFWLKMNAEFTDASYFTIK